MQRTRPEFRCAPVQGGELPMDAEMAGVLEAVTAAGRPVGFGPDSEHPLPTDLAKRFDVQSHIATAVYPKGDKP